MLIYHLKRLHYFLIILIIGVTGCTSEDVMFPDLANFFLIVFAIFIISFIEQFRIWSLVIILIFLIFMGAWKTVGIVLGISAVILFILLLINSSVDEIFKIPGEEEITKRKDFDSKGEQKLYDIIRELYPHEKIKLHESPAWLGGNQHIDIYLPKRGIAIEYQGKQHYEPVDYYGGKENFLRQKELDERKRRKCEKYGVELIYFSYNETINRNLVRRKIEIANPDIKKQRNNIRKNSYPRIRDHYINENVVKSNSKVKIRYLNTNQVLTVKLVEHPPGKLDSSLEVKRIHKHTLLARVLIGKKIGEKIEIRHDNYLEVIDITNE